MPERPTAYGHAADQRDVEQITRLITNLEAGMNTHDVDVIVRQFTGRYSNLTLE